jgi:hypothetical protein
MNAERKAGAEAIYLRLPLSSPAAPQIAEACEKLGLSFAGVMPLICAGTDVLVMQWVGVPLDMDAIRIHGDRGRRHVRLREELPRLLSAAPESPGRRPPLAREDRGPEPERRLPRHQDSHG